MAGWLDPTPHGFFGLLFQCASARTTTGSATASSTGRFARRMALEVTDTRAAGVQWTAIDHELVERAVVVPLVNPHWIDRDSRNAQNCQGDPYLGLIVDQVALR